jgi:hypothetical protein
MVIIINHDEVAQLQVTSSTSCFTGNALHSAAISEKGKGMVVDDFEPRLVELGCGVSLRNC